MTLHIHANPDVFNKGLRIKSLGFWQQTCLLPTYFDTTKEKMLERPEYVEVCDAH